MPKLQTPHALSSVNNNGELPNLYSAYLGISFDCLQMLVTGPLPAIIRPIAKLQSSFQLQTSLDQGQKGANRVGCVP